MSNLRDFIESDKYLDFKSGGVVYNTHPSSKSDHRVMKVPVRSHMEILYVLEFFERDTSGITIDKIEIPALSKIIRLLIFDNDIGINKSVKIAILLSRIAAYQTNLGLFG